jgi:hypothetical protein
MIRTVKLADVAPQPWRNGGGSTRELLTWPGAEDWRLRLSVARIDRDGPFSAFPGVERWFAVLEGVGVELSWQSRTAHLHQGTPPLHFEGADPPAARLLGGATEDLNLMLRADAGTGAMQAARAGQPWQPAARWRGLFTLDACTLHAGGLLALEGGTLAWSDQALGPWHVEAAGPLRAWWLHLAETPPP